MKMYPEATSIFEYIKKSENIVINMHRNPDLDSVGSASSMCELLRTMGKKVTLICPHKLSSKFFFIKHARSVLQIDYADFDFTPYDLFILIDTANFYVASDKRDLTWASKLTVPTMVLDHHKTNSIKSTFKLIDEQANAAGEILYYLFEQWKVSFNCEIATALYASIIGDTVFLRYKNNPENLYKVLAHLIELGADEKLVLSQYYDFFSLEHIQMFGEFLKHFEINSTETFAWTALNYETYVHYKKPLGIREAIADDYGRAIGKSKFGLVLLEEEPGKVMMSFRSSKVDVSQVAKLFNGGGHAHAAGAVIYGDFDKTVNKILNVIEKFLAERSNIIDI